MKIHKFSYFGVHDVIVFGNVKAILLANTWSESTLQTLK